MKIDGWALESRVYAENPLRSFLPSTGLLKRYVEPDVFKSGSDFFRHPKALRVESGIKEGLEINSYYDPMISKLITWGKNRDKAMERMRMVLDCYKIEGLQHNIGFIRTILDHPRFISGDYTTKFIEEEYPEGFSYSFPTGNMVFPLSFLLVSSSDSLRDTETQFLGFYCSNVSGTHPQKRKGG